MCIRDRSKLDAFVPVALTKFPKFNFDPFLSDIELLSPDLFVVVAFRMLPEILINIPKLGTIYLHSSLLPDYRGAAPINWVIINGEKETGLTTFFINKRKLYHYSSITISKVIITHCNCNIFKNLYSRIIPPYRIPIL